MDEDRSTGVNEARFALTLVICLLVAIGYVALFRLNGGSTASPIETLPRIADKPFVSPPDDNNDPQVLPLEKQNGPSTSRTPEVAVRPDGAHGEGSLPRPKLDSGFPTNSPDPQRR